MTKFDGRQYQSRFDALAAQGVDVHGEASLVRSYAPTSVLDAGCGTGRVAVELARHGIDVVGVDFDASMLAEAKRLAPERTWIEADLASLDLGRTFDVVVLAGNVPLFCPIERRSDLVKACVKHVVQGGILIAGFELGRGCDIDDFDCDCNSAGATLEDRWATWERQPYSAKSTYAVSVYRR